MYWSLRTNILEPGRERINCQDFRRLAPEAQAGPCPVPQLLFSSLLPLCMKKGAVSFLHKVRHIQNASLTSLARGDLMKFAVRPEKSIQMALLVWLRNGRCACLFPFLLIPFSMPPAKYLKPIRSLHIEQGFLEPFAPLPTPPEGY